MSTQSPKRAQTARTPAVAPENGLSGKVVVVTGGGRGLGRLLATHFARAGAAVGIIARSASEIDTAVEDIVREGGTAVAATADLTDVLAAAHAVTKIRDRLGMVDVLINNAGIRGPVGPMWDVGIPEWWKAFETNVYGAFLATGLILPEMIAAGRGRIINITSDSAIYHWPLLSAYSASKAALVRLTERLAHEARRHGVSVFSVDPGMLPIGLDEPALQGSTEEPLRGRFYGWVREQLANGHGADPEKAAQLVMKLASGRANLPSGCHVSVHDSIDRDPRSMAIVSCDRDGKRR